jgi:hypothetical protein
MVKRIALMLTGAAVGVGWLFVLSYMSNGRGLVSVEMGEILLDWVVVIVLSCGSFIFGAQVGWFAFLGWAGGQLAFLTYDAMPKGRSPELFQPTNFYEAAVFAALMVVGFNWPAFLGATGGFFMGRALRANKSHSTS